MDDSNKENDDFVQLPKRRKVSAKKRSIPAWQKERFSKLVSIEKLGKMSKGFIPDNTKKNTSWVISTFKQWAFSQNQRTRTDEEAIDEEIFAKKSNCEELCRALCLFVVEARKVNGDQYPPQTIFHLLAGLLRHARSVRPNTSNFLDPKDVQFRDLHGTMDTLFRKLRKAGAGTDVKHSTVITAEEENLLWERGVLGMSTLLPLLRNVFYYNGKIFCFTGGEEHRMLKFSQLQRVSCGYIYSEHGSNNHSGGLRQPKVQNKSVPSYAVEEGERCHVRFLDLYFKKVLKEALHKDAFYLRPLPKVIDPSDSI